jgi:predicted  nucleic acid-binding Zn-ribbon protein
MNPDLDRLIQLQRLDDATAAARAKIDAFPSEMEALDARLATGQGARDAAQAALDDNQRRRRELERDLGTAQARLSKYREQLMAVKTNKEYQAMLHEIATAETDVRSTEDRILDRMETAEGLTAQLKEAELALTAERAAIEEEKTRLEATRVVLERQVLDADSARTAIVRELGRDALALFEHVARARKGVAMARAVDGHCTECHVRLRPQHYNEVRRNDSLIQCESCMRILYYVEPGAGAVSAQAGA